MATRGFIPDFGAKTTQLRKMTGLHMYTHTHTHIHIHTYIHIHIYIYRKRERERDTQLFKWFLNGLFFCVSVREKNVGLSPSKKFLLYLLQ